MATAREIMSGGAECIGENESLAEAAKKMRERTSARCRYAGRTTA